MHAYSTLWQCFASFMMFYLFASFVGVLFCNVIFLLRKCHTSVASLVNRVVMSYSCCYTGDVIFCCFTGDVIFLLFFYEVIFLLNLL